MYLIVVTASTPFDLYLNHITPKMLMLFLFHLIYGYISCVRLMLSQSKCNEANAKLMLFISISVYQNMVLIFPNFT